MTTNEITGTATISETVSAYGDLIIRIAYVSGVSLDHALRLADTGVEAGLAEDVDAALKGTGWVPPPAT